MIDAARDGRRCAATVCSEERRQIPVIIFTFGKKRARIEKGKLAKIENFNRFVLVSVSLQSLHRRVQYCIS